MVDECCYRALRHVKFPNHAIHIHIFIRAISVMHAASFLPFLWFIYTELLWYWDIARRSKLEVWAQLCRHENSAIGLPYAVKATETALMTLRSDGQRCHSHSHVSGLMNDWGWEQRLKKTHTPAHYSLNMVATAIHAPHSRNTSIYWREILRPLVNTTSNNEKASKVAAQSSMPSLW